MIRATGAHFHLMRTVAAFMFLLGAALANAAALPYDEAADGRTQIAQALSSARSANVPLLVVFGANWCADCRMLDAAFKEGASAGLIGEHFRVVKVDVHGRWMKTWGERGSGESQFNILHSIASDAKGNVYVADRTNRRIQVFDPDGNFLRQFTIDVPFDKAPNVMVGAMPSAGSNPLAVSGAPWAICITPGPNQVLYSADAVPGRIYKVALDGKVLGVLGEAGKDPKQFGWIHEIACPSENELYVAELLNWRVQKLALHPERR